MANFAPEHPPKTPQPGRLSGLRPRLVNFAPPSTIENKGLKKLHPRTPTSPHLWDQVRPKLVWRDWMILMWGEISIWGHIFFKKRFLVFSPNISSITFVPFFLEFLRGVGCFGFSKRRSDITKIRKTGTPVHTSQGYDPTLGVDFITPNKQWRFFLWGP